MYRALEPFGRRNLRRGTTLLELIVAGGIGIFVVMVITTFITRVINNRVKEEGRVNAAEDVRRIEAALKKAGDRQVTGTVSRIEANLTACTRPLCPGLSLNTTSTTVRLVSACVPGPEPEASRLNASVTACLNTSQFPSTKCPAGQRPTVRFIETGIANAATINEWMVPFPVQRGKTVTHPENSGASICVTEQGDHVAIDLDQVVLEQGGDGKPTVLKRSLVLPRSVITGYQIK
jgi:hypothetical protein